MIRGVDGHDADEIKTAIDTAMQIVGQADADLLPHHDRLRLAQQGRQGIRARRAAGQGRSRRHARGSWTGRTRRSRSRRRSATAGAPATPALVREHQWNQLFDAYAAQYPRHRRRTGAPLARRAAGRLRRRRRCLRREAAGRRPGGRLAQGLADGDRGVRAAAAGTGRRLGRPGPFQPDAVEGQQVGRQRRRRRQLRLLTACANSR